MMTRCQELSVIESFDEYERSVQCFKHDYFLWGEKGVRDEQNSEHNENSLQWTLILS
jgi:hypothetical protein